MTDWEYEGIYHACWVLMDKLPPLVLNAQSFGKPEEAEILGRLFQAAISFRMTFPRPKTTWGPTTAVGEEVSSYDCMNPAQDTAGQQQENER